MTAIDRNDPSLREGWEHEVFARHRWGHARHGEKAITEHTHLQAMWNVIPVSARPPEALICQITDLEICNWNLESNIQALCYAIGANERLHFAVGHLASCTEERWRKIWAYYLALLEWLPRNVPGGTGSMLHICDPEGTVAAHVRDMLGECTALKELYVARFCLTLEFWLRGQSELSAECLRGHHAAIEALETEIAQRDPDPQLLQALNGNLFPCHHKLFRRFAIILSSIGVGRWRGAMAVKGDGPAERATAVEHLLQPIDAWLTGAGRSPGDPFYASIAKALGESNPTKRFLATLLISLLRSQEIDAAG